MNLNIKTTNLENETEARDYLQKKLQSIKKIVDLEADNVFAHVELAKSTEHHKLGKIFRAGIELRDNGYNVRVVAEEETITAAIDTMKDELVREIKNGKEKFMSKVKRGGAMAKQIFSKLSSDQNE